MSVSSNRQSVPRDRAARSTANAAATRTKSAEANKHASARRSDRRSGEGGRSSRRTPPVPRGGKVVSVGPRNVGRFPGGVNRNGLWHSGDCNVDRPRSVTQRRRDAEGGRSARTFPLSSSPRLCGSAALRNTHVAILLGVALWEWNRQVAKKSNNRSFCFEFHNSFLGVLGDLAVQFPQGPAHSINRRRVSGVTRTRSAMRWPTTQMIPSRSRTTRSRPRSAFATPRPRSKLFTDCVRPPRPAGRSGRRLRGPPRRGTEDRARRRRRHAVEVQSLVVRGLDRERCRDRRASVRPGTGRRTGSGGKGGGATTNSRTTSGPNSASIPREIETRERSSGGSARRSQRAAVIACSPPPGRRHAARNTSARSVGERGPEGRGGSRSRPVRPRSGLRARSARPAFDAARGHRARTRRAAPTLRPRAGCTSAASFGRRSLRIRFRVRDGSAFEASSRNGWPISAR